MVIANGTLFTSGFGESRYAPVLRVHLRGETSATSDRVTDIGEIGISPNPATTSTTLSIDLPQVADELEIRLTDLLGRTLRTLSFSASQNLKVEIPTADLPIGQYLLEVRTDRGREVAKLSVQ